MFIYVLSSFFSAICKVLVRRFAGSFRITKHIPGILKIASDCITNDGQTNGTELVGYLDPN
jgi:hypothetical protein